MGSKSRGIHCSCQNISQDEYNRIFYTAPTFEYELYIGKGVIAMNPNVEYKPVIDGVIQNGND